jgi:anti-sigma-K factor RskA
MSIHDDIQEIIPAYVLGALEQEEAARAGAHLGSCERCTCVLEEYSPVASALALAVPIVPPPSGLKSRVMQRALAQEGAKSFREPVARSLIGWQRLGFAPTFAGAALVLALAVFGWNIWQTAQLSRAVEAQRAFLTAMAYAQGSAQIVHGTELAPDAVGRFYREPDSSVAALVTVNMPPLAEGRVYQVWLTESDGTKFSAGVFHPDSEGNGWLLVRAPRHLDAYVQVGITTEPTGGSKAPTTKPVLLARFTPTQD